MIEGIILAAGLSSRLNTNKLLLDIGGKSLIERVILGMYNTCHEILVIGGHRIEDIWMMTKNYSKVNLIYNENYLDGMFSSLKTGLKHSHGKKIFIIPGDYPFISNDIYERMNNANGDIVIPTYHSMRGHPLLIDSRFKDEILFSNYSSLRDFLKNKFITYIDVFDPSIIQDIDTMDDYYTILEKLKEEELKAL
ncbi:nucleotidyltransferase family protein [Wansuia hejianensis]|uniref:Nucleotidyltransferase family protein n=1 Tax=Wansuia hejianensis TaxID=2763667 RepID=A0A926EX46_9FIRM|nr:nucleotidyltransferase family protein [Wansuia hejianensis]